MRTTSPRPEPFQRPRYFAGQLLTEAELGGEQRYLLAKSRLHNRLLHGSGVVCGLQVVCHPECKGYVRVMPGYALDPCGNDVMVPEQADFPLIEAIRKCRDAQRRMPDDCDPIAPPRVAECRGIEEEWCLTIAYAESEQRPLLAPRSEPCDDGACSCGAHGDACGCNGNGHAPRPPACEPTRIREGYRLGVARADDETPADELPSFDSEMKRCLEAFAPLRGMPSLEGMTAPAARKACCDYLRAVEKVLHAAPGLRCELRQQLADLECPNAQGGDGEIIARADAVVHAAHAIAAEALLDCVCVAMLPPCPPTPGDARLVLACITVRDDEILRICAGRRRQVIGFPTLDYWLADTVPYAKEALPALFGSEGSPAIFLLALAAQRQYSAMLEHWCCDGNLTLETLFGIDRAQPVEDG
jgi:hypothetical protein